MFASKACRIGSFIIVAGCGANKFSAVGYAHPDDDQLMAGADGHAGEHPGNGGGGQAGAGEGAAGGEAGVTSDDAGQGGQVAVIPPMGGSPSAGGNASVPSAAGGSIAESSGGRIGGGSGRAAGSAAGRPTSGGSAGANGAGVGGAGATCAGRTAVGYTKPPPSIMLLIDRSASMADVSAQATNLTRWDVVRDVVATAGTGAVARYQDNANLSVAFFTGPDGGVVGDASTAGTGDPYYVETTTCPYVERVPFGIDNFAVVDKAYHPHTLTSGTKGGRPAGETIESLMPAFTGLEGTRAFILVMSRDPGVCSQEENASEGFDRAITAVQTAYQAGISTYLVSIGGGSGTSQMTSSVALKVANAGQGLDPNDRTTDTLYFATNESQLKSTLDDIIGGLVGCHVTLNSPILSSGYDGIITIDGIKSQFRSGWQLNGDREIEFLANSCDQLKVAVAHTISISFPCDSVGQ
jgi:hypothetical protein